MGGTEYFSHTPPATLVCTVRTDSFFVKWKIEWVGPSCVAEEFFGCAERKQSNGVYHVYSSIIANLHHIETVS